MTPLNLLELIFWVIYSFNSSFNHLQRAVSKKKKNPGNVSVHQVIINHQSRLQKQQPPHELLPFKHTTSSIVFHLMYFQSALVESLSHSLACLWLSKGSRGQRSDYFSSLGTVIEVMAVMVMDGTVISLKTG